MRICEGDMQREDAGAYRDRRRPQGTLLAMSIKVNVREGKMI
jgi:hypothetical protein